MNKFSVIIPFYKGNKYLNKMLSILGQNADTLSNADVKAQVEVIIVNDSPMEAVILPEHSDKLNVKLIVHKKNSGIHQARITGLGHSTGVYIKFLDQDDEISDDCLLKEYNAIGKSDMVLSNAWSEKQNGHKALHFKGKGQYKNALIMGPYVKSHNQIISPGQCLIKRESIPSEWLKYVMKRNGSDDLFLWILMLAQNRKISIIEEPLYTHKYTGSNLSAEEVKMAESSMETAEFLKKIDYIPRGLIKDFIRNRRMCIESLGKNGLNRMWIWLKNIDILLPRIFWKLRSYTGKF